MTPALVPLFDDEIERRGLLERPAASDFDSVPAPGQHDCESVSLPQLASQVRIPGEIVARCYAAFHNRKQSDRTRTVRTTLLGR